MMLQLAQLAGALTILAAFALAQFRIVADTSRAYLLANLAGGATLAVLALHGSQWGFLVLEGSWALISAQRLIWGRQPVTQAEQVTA